jgi:hypothetical protein
VEEARREGTLRCGYRDSCGSDRHSCILRSKRSSSQPPLNGGVWLEEVLRLVLPSLKFSGLAIRCLVAAVPALVLVVFAGLIAFIGLFMGKDRREYVLALTAKLTDLARVLMGAPLSHNADPRALEVELQASKAPPDAAVLQSRSSE